MHGDFLKFLDGVGTNPMKIAQKSILSWILTMNVVFGVVSGNSERRWRADVGSFIN